MDQAPALGRNPASIRAQPTNRMTQTSSPAVMGQRSRSGAIRERRGLVTQEGAGMAGEIAQDDRAVVTFTVQDARPVNSKSLYALVDVELEIAGVALVIRGIQARHAPGGGTSVELPTYKAADGTWRPAIALPEETRGPLADAVLAFLLEEGLAKQRYGPAY